MPAAMSITLKIDGVEFVVASTDEAAELYKRLRSGEVRAKQQTPVKAAPNAKRPARRKRGIGFLKVAPPDVALKFLKTIRDAGAAGAAAEDVRKALGVTHPKGVGSRSAAINRLLRETQLSPEAVYDNPKSRNGVRVWKAGRRMNHAISALEQRLAAH